MSNLVAGVVVKVGGADYTVPPFNLRVLREHEAALNHVADGPEPVLASIDRMLPALLQNLQRNYPDLTREQLEDGLDLSSYPALVAASYGRAGFVKKEGGDPSPVAPAEAASQSTGAT